MGAVLGIDLGTTNSVVAVANGGEARVLADPLGRCLIPSVVSFAEGRQITVGFEARERRLVDSKHTVYSIKRLIGRAFASPQVARARERFPFTLVAAANGSTAVEVRGDEYALTEISAYVLAEVKRIAESALEEPSSRVVVTVPANFDELQRSATKAAGRIAGLDVIRILNEPTAAALAYGYGQSRPERVAVYDLGGGTFDITVLELDSDVFEVVATAGDTFLGGDDVDVLVADRMAEVFCDEHGVDVSRTSQLYERLRAAAEWTKCALSYEETAHLRIDDLARDPSGEPLGLDFQMTRVELEALLRPLVMQSFGVVDEAMRISGFKTADLNSIILVGGATRSPLVRQLVAGYFGRLPRAEIDPDLVVAQGAAIHAYSLSSETDRKALGRIALRKVTDHELSVLRKQVATSNARQPAFAPVREVEARPRRASDPVALPPPAPKVPTLPADRRPDPTGVHSTTRMNATPVTIEIEPEYAAEVGAMKEAIEDYRGEDAADSKDPALVMARRAPPLLMDVTPHSLGVETTGGYCRHLIPRNSPVPTERSRVFTTALDYQDAVVVRICQGEAERFVSNQVLGEVELGGLRKAPRGEVKIEVTFIIDADGTLKVHARDSQTGAEQAIRVNLLGGATEADMERMQMRQRSR